MICDYFEELLIFFLLFASPVYAFDNAKLGNRVWPPVHVNHTFLGNTNSTDGISLEVLAMGDVVGERELIVWVELDNNHDFYYIVNPLEIRIQIDDGPIRSCYYHKWSQFFRGSACNDLRIIRWKHENYNLSPFSSVGFWLVFLLPKNQFDLMTEIKVEYLDSIMISLNISKTRIVENTPYITINAPEEGEIYTGLRSINFRVDDVDLDPIEIEWWVEVDGSAVLSGENTQRYIGYFTVCPIIVEKDVDLELGNGLHDLVVYVSDKYAINSAQVNFSIIQREPQIPQLSVKWVLNISSLFQTTIFGSGHRSTQTVWDVDNDGENEIIFGTRRGDSKRLWCFSHDTRLEWVYPSLDMPGLLGDPTSKISLVDVDNNGVFELCFAGIGGRLHVLDGDGNLVWSWDEPNRQSMMGAPQAFDVNGDGYVEFFMNTEDGFIHRINHLGIRVWTSFQTQGGNLGHPTICDIDQDGLYDVVWACQDNYVYCIDAISGSEKWRFDTRANIGINEVIVVDVDKDGFFEALTWTSAPTSSVISIGPDGLEEWVWKHPVLNSNIRLCQAIGDLDRDGGMDMVVMTSDNAYALDISGKTPFIMWDINFTKLSQEGYLPLGAVSSYWSSYQLIADIDNDSMLEVLWLAPFPIVTDAVTGKLEAYYLNDDIAISRRAENGAWWGDIDNDGVSEWVVELHGRTNSGTQIYALSLGGEFPSESPWPEYYHSSYPASYQNQQDWLILKSAYSNSLWFPIPQIYIIPVVLMSLITIQILRMPGCGDVDEDGLMY